MKALLLPALLLGTLAGSALAQTPTAQRHIARPPAAAPAAQRLTSNPNFRLTTVLKQQYRGGAWLDTLRFTNSSFNAAGLPMRQLRENAPTRGAALRPLRQQNYRYNASSKLLSDTTYVYTSGVLNTTPTLTVNYAYDLQGRLQQEITALRVSGTWRPYGRTTYFYNTQGQNTRILDESYFGSAWLADDQEVFIYDTQGRVAMADFELADAAGTSFTPFIRDVFTYNAVGQRTTDVQQQYVNGAFVNTYRTTSSYNATGLTTGYVLEKAASATTWQPFMQGISTYDADDNLTQELSLLYRNGAYVNDERYLYTYQRVLAVAAPQRLDAGLSVYPNPSTGSAQVSYQLPQAAVASVEVLDVLGRVVATPLPGQPQGIGAQRLTLRQPLPAGVYTVRLSAAGRSQTQRLLVR
ncbi:T9SS type A sorting domain-containing protein [Hymenobacter jeollabukensis]|uniref:T9SS type A sorting domain-containing protein n=1 Tax=Hymenobacter jeollabukensis TaxID=2025313 RepID=A0A5R8WVA3_9BACT|nr:T9SS type A sorting domain-containing protein [Hymenobacter jeollabukensis]TLM95413.1 T9SS type A sorting domain-containing protein [Hymenobacter jeollabukensis]